MGCKERHLGVGKEEIVLEKDSGSFFMQLFWNLLFVMVMKMVSLRVMLVEVTR